MTEETTGPVKLDLQGVEIPAENWTPLPEEITAEVKDALLTRLISYSSKLDAPGRFSDVAGACRYFGIMSEAQITRLNEVAEKIKNPTAEAEGTEAEEESAA